MADLKAQLEAMRAAKQANPQPAGAPVAASDTQKAPVDLKAQLAQMRAQKQAPAEKKDGFIVGTLKSIGKSFAEPAVAAYNVAQTAKPVARGIASRIAGDRAAEQQAIQETETQLGQSRNLPFLGKTKPAFAENAMSGNDLGMAKEVIGRGADVASNIIGGGGVAAIGKQTLKGAVKQAVKTGLKEGALVGGMSGFGTELQQKDSTVGGVLGSTATGTALGAVAGAGLGAGGALAREGIVGGVKLAQKPFRSLETKTAEAIDSAIDKGLKPSVKKTAEKSQQFRTQAREAFNVINEYRPTLAREGEEAGVRNPENRAEMLDALQQAKKQLFNEYDNLTRESGEIGAKFDPTPILHRLDNISRDKAYNTETRAYAVKLMDEVGELKGENFGVVQERIKDFNSSLAGYYEGRVNKSKARLDASVASLMREITDTQVNSLTGGNWQGLRNKYGSLSAIERDLERQVAVEARKNAAGFFDITDIFTGGDLTAGILTANPALIARGMAGRGIKEAIKWVNNPNRYIKNAFELLNKQPVTKEMRVRPKIAGLLPERATPAPIQAGAPGELERQAANRAARERIFSPDAMKQAPMPEKPKIAGLLPAARKTASDINQGRPIQVAPRNVEYTGPEKVAGSFKAPQRIIEGEVVQPKKTAGVLKQKSVGGKPEKVTLKELVDSKVKLEDLNEDGDVVGYREELEYLIKKGYGGKTINEIIDDPKIQNSDKSVLNYIKKNFAQDLASLSKEHELDILIPSLRNTGMYEKKQDVDFKGAAKKLGLDKEGITDGTLEWVEKWINRYSKEEVQVPDSVKKQLEKYKPEAESVTLYRGAKKGSDQQELSSWTYDEDVAKRFARRVKNGEGEVIKKEISAKDIVVDFTRLPKNLLDNKTRIQEAEVIVQTPKKVAGVIKKKGVDQAFGAVAGVDYEKDENGKIKVKFDKDRAAIGLGLGIVGKKGMDAVEKKMFNGFTDISTKILEKLKDRTTVSKQFINDLTNSGDVKQVERELIRKALEFDGKDVNVADFANRVKAELLPIKPKELKSARYEGVSLPDEQRGKVSKYGEIIYESPIKTAAGEVHFRGDSENYFGHVRYEDITGGKPVIKSLGQSVGVDGKPIPITQQVKQGGRSTTRRIIEVQSDLFQKNRIDTEGAYGANTEIWAKGGTPEQKQNVLTREKELDALRQYNDPTAHFRMIREEVKRAAKDGKTKLQFPTGETAMKIEGLGEEGDWYFGKEKVVTAMHNGREFSYMDRVQLKPDTLKVGEHVFKSGSGDWIITDVLGDGKFKAVPKHVLEMEGDYKNFTNGQWESMNKSSSAETFDISGKVDTSNPIYKFYEKEVGRYATNKYGAKRIIDKNGVSWWEVDVKPEMKNIPIEAFGVIPFAATGLPLKKKEEKK